MQLVSRPELYTLVCQTNATTVGTSITFPVPAFTPPGLTNNGDGIIPCVGPDGVSGISAVKLVPFGVTAGTGVFLMAVFGWTPTRGNTTVFPVKQPLWIATSLAAFTVTYGTVPGLAGADVDNTQVFAGTITSSLGNTNFSTEILSPTGNTVCSAIVATKDAVLIEVRFAINAQVTSCNALYQRL